jgi:hypothetical protein
MSQCGLSTYLELLEQVIRKLGVVHAHVNVLVQISKHRQGNLRPVFTDILLGTIELRTPTQKTSVCQPKHAAIPSVFGKGILPETKGPGFLKALDREE